MFGAYRELEIWSLEFFLGVWYLEAWDFSSFGAFTLLLPLLLASRLH